MKRDCPTASGMPGREKIVSDGKTLERIAGRAITLKTEIGPGKDKGMVRDIDKVAQRIRFGGGSA
jgi:hypothetical protein